MIDEKNVFVTGTNPKDKKLRGGLWYDEPEMFQVSYQPAQAGIYNIYLFGDIEQPSQFIPALEVMARASENDMVLVHLHTNGGSLDATDTFLQGMRECEGKVIVKASGGVHSAGTIILLNAPHFVLSDNFHCLIHNGSCGWNTKYSDWRAYNEFTKDYMERTMRSTYEGFLTPEELDQLMAGKDYWFNADQFIERHHKRNEILRQKQEAEQEKTAQAMIKMFADTLNETEDKPAPVKKPRKSKPRKTAAVVENAVTL